MWKEKLIEDEEKKEMMRDNFGQNAGRFSDFVITL